MVFQRKKTEKSTALSVRAMAAQVILQVLDQGKSLSTLLPDVQLQVKPQDLPLLQEITFGICRVLPRLENIIKKLLDKPLKGKTRIVHCLLLVGLYQLLYMRVPAHAAVDEVVNATKSLKSDSFRGLVNGVLRRFLREQNNTKTYRTLLEEQEIVAFESDNPHALRLAQPLSVTKLPNFEQGEVTVQDLNAQWSALLLEPQNNELILDACAAPGGKTTHILEMAPQAKVIALDVEAHRLKRVEENLARLNQQATVVCGDATEPEKWLAEIGLSDASFDRILLDAPCSATGVIRRHPDIKWLRQETDIAQLVALQGQILKALWAKLKPNGILLYATCSVLPDENSQQIQHFLAETPDAELMPLPFGQTENTIGIQFLPQENGGDGFYYAKLRKRLA